MRKTNDSKKLACLLIASFLISAVGCARSVETHNSVPVVSAEPTPTAAPEFPLPTGLVNDFANVLAPREREDLEKTLVAFKNSHKVDFSIVTVKSTGAKSMDDYSLGMAKEWKIGSELGGVLYVIAIDDRAWRIQIDRKLESFMTNDEVKKLGEVALPDFKHGDHIAGVKKVVAAMIQALKEKLPKS